MHKIRQPQLLYRKNPDIYTLRYPLLVSPKLDGIRCLISDYDNKPYSRTMKPPPNRLVQQLLNHELLAGFDGELIVGPANHKLVYRRSNDMWRTFSATNAFTYYVFDDITDLNLPYINRYRRARDRISQLEQNSSQVRVKLLAHYVVNSPEELLAREQEFLGQGFEGMIIRDMTALYKDGRTTLREHNAFKLKRFLDSEAIIIDILPRMHNTNPAFVNETGNQVRSSNMEGLVPMDTMGRLKVVDVHPNNEDHHYFGAEFFLGSGWDASEAQAIWDKRRSILEKEEVVVYKYFPIGSEELPRTPIFKGFRDSTDILVE